MQDGAFLAVFCVRVNCSDGSAGLYILSFFYLEICDSGVYCEVFAVADDDNVLEPVHVEEGRYGTLKNCTCRGPGGNGYVYAPAIGENEYKRKFLARFVHDYFRSSYKEMVTFFARDEQLSPDDLQDIIREIEKGE